jgi:integrase
VTPHMLRRTFATLASREIRDKRGRVTKPAIPPYALQRLLGHEHLATTQRYVDAAAEADSIPTGTYLGVAPPKARAETRTDGEA